MPWSTVELKDGRKIPQIAFGSAAHSNESTSDIINQAIDVGFDHIDTAQSGSIVL
jgi:diketogulonate reductase-like aldo/keto reductase